jgi:hypothetical protein
MQPFLGAATCNVGLLTRVDRGRIDSVTMRGNVLTLRYLL